MSLKWTNALFVCTYSFLCVVFTLCREWRNPSPRSSRPTSGMRTLWASSQSLSSDRSVFNPPPPQISHLNIALPLGHLTVCETVFLHFSWDDINHCFPLSCAVIRAGFCTMSPAPFMLTPLFVARCWRSAPTLNCWMTAHSPRMLKVERAAFCSPAEGTAWVRMRVLVLWPLLYCDAFVVSKLIVSSWISLRFLQRQPGHRLCASRCGPVHWAKRWRCALRPRQHLSHHRGQRRHCGTNHLSSVKLTLSLLYF